MQLASRTSWSSFLHLSFFFHVTDTLIRRPDGSVGMALVLPALTDCRWWFESLLVHSGVSSATRRKATGADHKKRNWYADYQSCCLALVLFLCVCFFVVFACLFGCFFRPTPSWLSPGRSTCLFGCFPCVFSFVLWLQVSALWIMYRSNSVLFCGHMVQTVVATASIWLICWLPSAFWLDKRPGESHLALDGKKMFFTSRFRLHLRCAVFSCGIFENISVLRILLEKAWSYHTFLICCLHVQTPIVFGCFLFRFCVGDFATERRTMYRSFTIWRQPTNAVINQLILLRHAIEHVERPGESHEGVGRKKIMCKPQSNLNSRQRRNLQLPRKKEINWSFL